MEKLEKEFNRVLTSKIDGKVSKEDALLLDAEKKRILMARKIIFGY